MVSGPIHYFLIMLGSDRQISATRNAPKANHVNYSPRGKPPQTTSKNTKSPDLTAL